MLIELNPHSFLQKNPEKIMTKKETNDIAIDILTHFHICDEANDEVEAANSATHMIKTILERYPKLRYEIWQLNKEDVLDRLGLNYGNPFD